MHTLDNPIQLCLPLHFDPLDPCVGPAEQLNGGDVVDQFLKGSLTVVASGRAGLGDLFWHGSVECSRRKRERTHLDSSFAKVVVDWRGKKRSEAESKGEGSQYVRGAEMARMAKPTRALHPMRLC
jgi:hypothetical protein